MFSTYTRTKMGRAAFSVFMILVLISSVMSLTLLASAETSVNTSAGTVTDSDGMLDSPTGSETVSGVIGVDSATNEPSTKAPTESATSPVPTDTTDAGADDGMNIAGIIIAIVIIIAVIIIVVALIPKKKM